MNNSKRRRQAKEARKAVRLRMPPAWRTAREARRNPAFVLAYLAKGKPSWPPMKEEPEEAAA
jgi:hypothetical protein